LLFSFGAAPVVNGILLGICAVDYLDNVEYADANTPGLIADNVSRREEPRICLPICSFDLAHA
jgi:hypothetical protein